MIHFMKLRWLYFLISAVVIIPGLFSLVRFGLRPSIDFTGGSVLQVKLDQKQTNEISLEDVRNTVQKTMDVSAIQQAADNNLIIRAKPIDAAQKDAAVKELSVAYGVVQEMRFETVGPVLGNELIMKTLFAIALSAGLITLYVAYRFRSLRYGVCAVIAMFHDSLVLIGSFSLLGHFFNVEIDTLFVTAMLTILSFSVHDTIVVYDRIRELRAKLPLMSYTDTIDVAVTETVGRSLNNSLTIILMLIALLLLGGETIHWFVLALIIGMVTGTYSSTFTAAPLLVVWDVLEKKRKRK